MIILKKYTKSFVNFQLYERSTQNIERNITEYMENFQLYERSTNNKEALDSLFIIVLSTL